MARATDQMIGDLLLLTQAGAAPDQNIPLSVMMAVLGWITTFVVAILGALHGRKALLRGREEGKSSMTIDGHVTTKERQEFATRGDLNDLRTNINADIDQAHSRINAAFRGIDTLGGTVQQIDANVGRLLDLQLNLPPGTSARKPPIKKHG